MVIDVVPFHNAFVVKHVKEETLYTALENSISDAHTDGRFLQVSGLRLLASWQKPEGDRLLDVQIQNKSRGRGSYRIAMPSFVASGFDGYGCFKRLQVLKGTGAVTDTSLMVNIFQDSMLENEGLLETTVEQGIKRARGAVVIGPDPVHGVPQIRPFTDGRITFVDT